MRFLAPLLLLVLLAGCVVPGAAPDVRPASADASARFEGGILDPKVYHTGEPSMAVDPKGVVYVCAPSGAANAAEENPGMNYVWRSADGGKSFQRLGNAGRENAPGGGDCDVATDAKGRLFEVGLDGFPLQVVPSRITFVASDDGGKSWRDAQQVSLAYVTDRQWLATSGEDVFVTWQQIDTGIWVAKSTDHGKTWIQTLAMPRYLNAGVQRYFIEGPLRVGPDGTLYVPDASQNACDFWGCFTDPLPPVVDNPLGHQVFGNVAVSTDGGLTWTIRSQKDVPTGWAFAVDGAGTLYAGDVKCDRAPDSKNVTGCTPQLWISTDKAVSWKGPFNVTLPEKLLVSHLWIAAGSAGRVALGFYASEKLGFAEDDKEGDWFLHTAWSLDAARGADASWAFARVLPEPVHQGALHRDLVDYLSVVVDPTSGLTRFAYTSTVGLDEAHKGYGRIGEAHMVEGPSLLDAAALAEPKPAKN